MLVCLCIGNILIGRESKFPDSCYHESEVFFWTCKSSEFWGLIAVCHFVLLNISLFKLIVWCSLANFFILAISLQTNHKISCFKRFTCRLWHQLLAESPTCWPLLQDSHLPTSITMWHRQFFKNKFLYI